MLWKLCLTIWTILINSRWSKCENLKTRDRIHMQNQKYFHSTNQQQPDVQICRSICSHSITCQIFHTKFQQFTQIPVPCYCVQLRFDITHTEGLFIFQHPGLNDTSNASILLHFITQYYFVFLKFISQEHKTGYYRAVPRRKGYIYTGCPRRNGQNFGRVFLRLNYTDITQNTYIQS